MRKQNDAHYGGIAISTIAIERLKATIREHLNSDTKQSPMKRKREKQNKEQASKNPI